jgi:hypothetical protein
VIGEVWRCFDARLAEELRRRFIQRTGAQQTFRHPFYQMGCFRYQHDRLVPWAVKMGAPRPGGRVS